MGRKNYFAGWYYKQEKGEEVIAFIPSWHRVDGRIEAFIQAVTKTQNWTFSFPDGKLRVCEKKDRIRIGENLFTPEGIRVRLSDEIDGQKIRICGSLKFEKRVPLFYDIMGPFAFIPFLQCRHGVVSMSHTVSGSLRVNEEVIDFDKGRGYTEKDSGSSFPGAYFWCQCGWEDGGPCSVMAAVADIPFAGFHFKGCIAAITFRGEQYRLATYLGVRIIRDTDRELFLRQGRLCLRVQIIRREKGKDGLSLQAPQEGKMQRIIREKLTCRIRIRLWRSKELLFDHTGTGSAEAEGAFYDRRGRR